MNQLVFTGFAPEAIQVGLTWSFDHGWKLRLATRPSGAPWREAEIRSYEGLTSGEALDVLCLEMARIFGVVEGEPPSLPAA